MISVEHGLQLACMNMIFGIINPFPSFDTDYAMVCPALAHTFSIQQITVCIDVYYNAYNYNH